MTAEARDMTLAVSTSHGLESSRKRPRLSEDAMTPDAASRIEQLEAALDAKETELTLAKDAAKDAKKLTERLQSLHQDRIQQIDRLLLEQRQWASRVCPTPTETFPTIKQEVGVGESASTDENTRPSASHSDSGSETGCVGCARKLASLHENCEAYRKQLASNEQTISVIGEEKSRIVYQRYIQLQNRARRAELQLQRYLEQRSEAPLSENANSHETLALPTTSVDGLQQRLAEQQRVAQRSADECVMKLEAANGAVVNASKNVKALAKERDELQLQAMQYKADLARKELELIRATGALKQQLLANPEILKGFAKPANAQEISELRRKLEISERKLKNSEDEKLKEIHKVVQLKAEVAKRQSDSAKRQSELAQQLKDAISENASLESQVKFLEGKLETESSDVIFANKAAHAAESQRQEKQKELEELKRSMEKQENAPCKACVQKDATVQSLMQTKAQLTKDKEAMSVTITHWERKYNDKEKERLKFENAVSQMEGRAAEGMARIRKENDDLRLENQQLAVEKQQEIGKNKKLQTNLTNYKATTTNYRQQLDRKEKKDIPALESQVKSLQGQLKTLEMQKKSNEAILKDYGAMKVRHDQLEKEKSAAEAQISKLNSEKINIDQQLKFQKTQSQAQKASHEHLQRQQSAQLAEKDDEIKRKGDEILKLKEQQQKVREEQQKQKEEKQKLEADQLKLKEELKTKKKRKAEVVEGLEKALSIVKGL